MVAVNTLKKTWNQALPVGAVGLLIGAAGGWAGLLSADRAAEVAAVAARFFPSLIILLPLALFLSRRASSADGEAETTANRLLVGLLGAILAIIFFPVTAIQVPAVFGGPAAAETLPPLLDSIGWRWPAILIVVMLAVALLLEKVLNR